jgi:hypothetical protein
MGVIQSAERLASQRPPLPHEDTYTCASFVYRAFSQQSLACTPSVVFEDVRSRPARYRNDAQPPALPLALVAAEAEAGDLGLLQQQLDNYSILELSGAVEPQAGNRSRSSQTSRMNGDQLTAATRNLIRIFSSIDATDLPPRMHVDERWVSPGDLWRLKEIRFRATVAIRC